MPAVYIAIRQNSAAYSPLFDKCQPYTHRHSTKVSGIYTLLFNKCQRHTHRYSTNVSGIHRYSTQVILTVSFGSSAGRVHLLHQRPLKTKRRWRRRQFWRRRLFDDEIYSHVQNANKSHSDSQDQHTHHLSSHASASNRSCRHLTSLVGREWIDLHRTLSLSIQRIQCRTNIQYL